MRWQPAARSPTSRSDPATNHAPGGPGRYDTMHDYRTFPRSLAEAFADERFPAMFGPYRRSRRRLVRAIGAAVLLALIALGALGA